MIYINRVRLRGEGRASRNKTYLSCVCAVVHTQHWRRSNNLNAAAAAGVCCEPANKRTFVRTLDMGPSPTDYRCNRTTMVFLCSARSVTNRFYRAPPQYTESFFAPTNTINAWPTKYNGFRPAQSQRRRRWPLPIFIGSRKNTHYLCKSCTCLIIYRHVGAPPPALPPPRWT